MPHHPPDKCSQKNWHHHDNCHWLDSTPSSDQICHLHHHFFSVTIIIAIIVIIMVMKTEHSVFNSDQRGPVGVQSRCNSIFLLLHHNHRHNHRHNHLLVDFKYHELLVSFVITILQSKSRSATTSINQPPSLESPRPLFNLVAFQEMLWDKLSSKKFSLNAFQYVDWQKIFERSIPGN